MNPHNLAKKTGIDWKPYFLNIVLPFTRHFKGDGTLNTIKIKYKEGKKEIGSRNIRSHLLKNLC